MTYALITDVAATLGRPITDETEVAQVNAWISGVETIIRTRLGVERFADLDPDTARFVVSEAVARRVRNPDGKQNERIDDYSYGLTHDAARADLFLTDDEWALLAPTSSTGAFSIIPGGRAYGITHFRPDWWEPRP